MQLRGGRGEHQTVVRLVRLLDRHLLGPHQTQALFAPGPMSRRGDYVPRERVSREQNMTFNQIEEVRQGHKPSLSLEQAYNNLVRLRRASGLTFERCPECRGHGWTKATLLPSVKAIEVLARECPDETPAIQYDRCERCRGDGGWLVEDRKQ